MIAAMLVLISVRARAADLPPGIDYPTIRALVAHHGKPAALRRAITQGYGWREIAAARRLLSERVSSK